MIGMKLMSRGLSIADVRYSSEKELFPLRAHLVAGLVTFFCNCVMRISQCEEKKSELILRIRLPPYKDQVNLNIGNRSKRSINV